MSKINQPVNKASSNSEELARSKSRYFLTWRWHFYAGLFVIPFMLMLSLTGLVMLFDDEIEFSRYQSVLEVRPEATTITISRQIENVLAAYPDAMVTQLIPAKSSELANRFSIMFESGKTVFVTVNPYNGDIIGTIDRSDSWYELANDIHGTLLLGDWGDYLIEIAASLGVILLVTGVYLWLPRDKASKAGFLKIRMTSGPRILMRDLHANIGGLLSFVLLFFFISGLAWASVWGGKFVQAWSSFPAEKWDDVPLSTQSHASMNHGSEEEIPWNLEQTLMPESHDHAAMLAAGAGAMQHDTKMAHDMNIHTEVKLGVDQILAQAKTLGFTLFKLNFPRSETGVYTLAANTMSGDITDPRLDRTTHIDQYSGRVLADVTWNEYNPMAKFMAAGIALHQGDVSVVNKIVNVFFCLAFIFIAISGAVMWWIRRPAGKKVLGAPPRFEHEGVWKVGLITIVSLSFMLPMAGGTIALVLFVDWLVFSRVNKLKLALN
ncbi:putative iron-regulated membrane protein [Moritella sp. JT01]|uniref:PepSY-associated TM helix domain-containing protein n=1 Tax=Moritella sp. JT01 TaxID=756698 RepID=UPI000798C7FD|nr:PepSY domain-containing protein [Moritella sp. JT01]KXO07291.1 putative iron-regulated membrane protein [Moritella sp. JT01]